MSMKYLNLLLFCPAALASNDFNIYDGTEPDIYTCCSLVEYNLPNKILVANSRNIFNSLIFNIIL